MSTNKQSAKIIIADAAQNYKTVYCKTHMLTTIPSRNDMVVVEDIEHDSGNEITLRGTVTNYQWYVDHDLVEIYCKLR